MISNQLTSLEVMTFTFIKKIIKILIIIKLFITYIFDNYFYSLILIK